MQILYYYFLCIIFIFMSFILDFQFIPGVDTKLSTSFSGWSENLWPAIVIETWNQEIRTILRKNIYYFIRYLPPGTIFNKMTIFAATRLSFPPTLYLA